MSDKPADTISNTDGPLKDGSSSFGSFFPKHYVLAILNTDEEAAKAGDALRAGGFPGENVIVASGAEVVKHETDAKADQGIFSKIGEQWSKLYTDESADAKAIINFAKGGAAFVLAYAPEIAETERAAEILRPFQPGVMRKYDTLKITELM